ncbi:hypothetical protein E2C01_060068 [Portunus trituberculatus]|uniref:Uncharacterized protein n=1 Tax=Portunus trituberculatus TaxID=210409 RepID=A0A5B7H185_PORTR|nr:hypothetical protein [Portunus trituberculatus]
MNNQLCLLKDLPSAWECGLINLGGKTCWECLLLSVTPPAPRENPHTSRPVITPRPCVTGGKVLERTVAGSVFTRQVFT